MSSAIGPLALLPRDGTIGRFAGRPELSLETQKLVDDEIRRVVIDEHEEVVTLLKRNRERLDNLARALLEHETLDGDDAYAAAGVSPPSEPPVEAYAKAARSTTG
jgi:cell division protease FtsH